MNMNTNAEMLSLICRDIPLTEDEAKQVGKYMHSLQGEELGDFWSELQKHSKNLWMVHPWISLLMVRWAEGETLPSWSESQVRAAEIFQDVDGSRERVRQKIFGC